MLRKIMGILVHSHCTPPSLGISLTKGVKDIHNANYQYLSDEIN